MDSDLAWAAGFIDGEGCIGAYTNGLRSSVVVSLSVSQKYHRPLLKLIDLFGGHMKPKHTPEGFMEWRLYSTNAINVLKLVSPYLQTNKKEQALLAIELQERLTTRGKKLSQEEWDYRANLAGQIKEWKNK